MERARTWNIAIAAVVALLQCGGVSQGHPLETEVSTDDADCSAFLDFWYIFDKYPHNHTAVLELGMRRHVPDVLVRMRSADCNFRCDTVSFAPCNVTTQATREPSSVEYYGKHSVHQYYAFHIIDKYFCASVSLHRCNSLFNQIDTTTDYFGEVGKALPVRLQATKQPVVVVVLCVSLAAAALLATAAYCIKTRLCSLSLGGPVPLEEKLSDRRGTNSSPLLQAPLPPPPTSAILLLYSRDSDGFVRLMEAFRKLLTALTGIEVVDPLDSRRMEEVFPVPVSWLSRQLRRQDVKVVVVVSAGALARQRALLRQRTPDFAAAATPHALDSLFTHALREMQDDYRIGGDYRRVYKVRFEDITTTTETLYHIVPMRVFHLMRHIGRLVHEIRGEVYPPDADDVTHSQQLLRNIPEADSLFVNLREVTG